MKILRHWHKLVGHSELGGKLIKSTNLPHHTNDRDFVRAERTYICKCGETFTCIRGTFRDGVEGYLARSDERHRERLAAAQVKRMNSDLR